MTIKYCQWLLCHKNTHSRHEKVWLSQLMSIVQNACTVLSLLISLSSEAELSIIWPRYLNLLTNNKGQSPSVNAGKQMTEWLIKDICCYWRSIAMASQNVPFCAFFVVNIALSNKKYVLWNVERILLSSNRQHRQANSVDEPVGLLSVNGGKVAYFLFVLLLSSTSHRFWDIPCKNSPDLDLKVIQGQSAWWEWIVYGWFHIRLPLIRYRICHRFRNIWL